MSPILERSSEQIFLLQEDIAKLTAHLIHKYLAKNHWQTLIHVLETLTPFYYIRNVFCDLNFNWLIDWLEYLSMDGQAETYPRLLINLLHEDYPATSLPVTYFLYRCSNKSPRKFISRWNESNKLTSTPSLSFSFLSNLEPVSCTYPSNQYHPATNKTQQVNNSIAQNSDMIKPL